jgi:putative addiction module component (TIGR02574 family)
MPIDSELLSRALEMPVRERAELARRLLLSLETADFDADVEEAWAEEIEARLSAVDRGDSIPVDWRPAIDRIRGSLRRDPAG